jgi:excisionase family DNA binding protein
MPDGITLDAVVERLLDEALERKLHPLLAEMAELRAALHPVSASVGTDDYLRPRDVGRLLKVDVQTVNRWIRTKKLEAEGPRRARRVTRAAVEKFMATRNGPSDGVRDTDLDNLADAALRRRHRR